ncbi:hypothetical protein L915_12926 [Phytophthora nicotianae]|uniref:Uncharacterized protein n=1 Tax=Phytophthora nicotianae TaxID=4792 RepID=W2GEV3_PHYNI|nr:hypothetical protein L915_12926 [Phytophthora nicotianae]
MRDYDLFKEMKALSATTFKQLVKRGNIHSKVVAKQTSIC